MTKPIPGARACLAQIDVARQAYDDDPSYENAVRLQYSERYQRDWLRRQLRVIEND